MLEIISMTLPWPAGISVNHCWQRNGTRTYLSPAVRRFRQEAWATVAGKGSFDSGASLALELNAWPPDKRRRDVDNLLKSCADALQYAGLFNDDCQIMRISAEKHPPDGNPRLEITVSCIPGS